jgi:hypothetical protein
MSSQALFRDRKIIQNKRKQVQFLSQLVSPKISWFGESDDAQVYGDIGKAPASTSLSSGGNATRMGSVTSPENSGPCR